MNNCSPSSDHINSSSLDHNHHQNLRSRGADSSSSYFKFKPFQPLRFAPPTAALTAATAAAAAAAAAAVSSGEHLTNASNQVASPSLLKTAHNKSISPSPSSLAIHNLSMNQLKRSPKELSLRALKLKLIQCVSYTNSNITYKFQLYSS